MPHPEGCGETLIIGMAVLSLACADINKFAASDLIRFIDVFGRRTRYYSNNVVLDANRNKRVSFVSIFSLCDIDIYERDRSDTNHLMVESLLQQKGWTAGWATLLAISGNLVTISSRSFGVADKIKSGLGVAGPVIDNYANLLLNDPNLAFTYFPYSAVSPTYVAVLKNSRHADEARAFIHYLLSPKGQRILADANTGKYPVAPLSADNPRAAQQQRLMAQPPLNYRLILKRQQLVQRMFDTAISFRLAQLKDAWRALHSAETRLKRPLPEIRALLTSVPVDAASSEDETWLAQFDNKSFAEQKMMEWQIWFLNNQRLAIHKLEELK